MPNISAAGSNRKRLFSSPLHVFLSRVRVQRLLFARELLGSQKFLSPVGSLVNRVVFQYLQKTKHSPLSLLQGTPPTLWPLTSQKKAPPRRWWSRPTSGSSWRCPREAGWKEKWCCGWCRPATTVRRRRRRKRSASSSWIQVLQKYTIEKIVQLFPLPDGGLVRPSERSGAPLQLESDTNHSQLHRNWRKSWQWHDKASASNYY